MNKTLITLMAAAGIALGGCRDDKDDQPQPEPVVQEPAPVYSTFGFTNKEGIPYSLALARWPNRVGISGDHRLHFYEATSKEDTNVSLDESIVLTKNPSTGTTPFTHVLRYIGHDPVNRQLMFEDFGTGFRQVTYDGETNYANLVVGGITYGVQVNPATGRLAIDQNGDGVYNGAQAPIIDIGDVVTTEADLLAP